MGGTGGLEIGVEAEVTPEAQTLKDLEGPEIAVEANVAGGGRVGLGTSYNLVEGRVDPFYQPGYTINIGIGTPEIGGQVYYSETTVHDFKRNQDIDSWYEYNDPYYGQNQPLK